jgi:molybdenum cofactor guanylyltransferase
MKIGCIILAGGKSSRMGEDKALLEYEGKYFIEKIAEELSFFEEKIIARGNNSSLTEITDSKWQVIPDIYLDHGPMGGMHAALKTCESDAMFVVTCDMPLITGHLVRQICEAFDQQYDALIVVTSDGKYHPLCGIYRKELYESMEEYLKQDNNRMMAVLKKCRLKYLQLDEVCSKQLMNVNTKEEYGKIICSK